MVEQQRIINQSDLKRIVEIVSRATKAQLQVPSAMFFLDQTENMAKRLLGTYLLRVKKKGKGFEIVGGKIVESEAYLDKTDPASHAATVKITARNQIFYETGGVSYVFHARSIYYCFNVIVRTKGLAGCVLIRALEPIMGIEIMAQRRSKSSEQIYDICSGPGKICQALGINHLHTGCDLRRSELLILVPKKKQIIDIASGPRIGISKATDWPLRFWEKDSKYVSK